MTSDADELLTIGPAAKRAGVSPGWLRQLANLGKVPCTRVGQLRLFRAVDLDAYRLARGPRRGPKPGE